MSKYETPRQRFVRHAAQLLVDGINAGRIARTDVSPTAIKQSLCGAEIERLALVNRYYTLGQLTSTQQTSLARAIAGAVANHPDRQSFAA